jgi:surfactin synthase thioesterase subunit
MCVVVGRNEQSLLNKYTNDTLIIHRPILLLGCQVVFLISVIMSLVVLNKPAQTRVVMFCFHPSGSNASLFKMWANSELTTAGVELIGVNLPGRRPNEVLADYDSTHSKPFEYFLHVCVNVLVPVICGHMTKKLPIDNLPIAFFGHSLGSLVAFEVIRAFERTQCRYVVNHMIVSAALSPVELSIKNLSPQTRMHHKETDVQLFDHIVDIGNECCYV